MKLSVATRQYLEPYDLRTSPNIDEFEAKLTGLQLLTSQEGWDEDNPKTPPVAAVAWAAARALCEAALAVRRDRPHVDVLDSGWISLTWGAHWGHSRGARAIMIRESMGVAFYDTGNGKISVLSEAVKAIHGSEAY